MTDTPDGYVIYDIFLPDCEDQEHPDMLCEEASSDWGKGANVTLSDDTTYYMSRTASLKAVSDNTDDVYYYPSGKDLAQDMTGADAICLWYRSSVTNAFRVSIHTNDSNYKYKDITPSAVDTFYFEIIKISNMTESGTFDITDVDYIQIDHKNTNRTMYIDLLAVGKLFEIDNIAGIDTDKEVYVDIQPGLYRKGDFSIPKGEASRTYSITFVIADDALTDQELIDEVNIVEIYLPRKEAMIYHSEPDGLQRTSMRGKAILSLSVSTSWLQSRLRDYVVSMEFRELDNSDAS